MTISSWPLCLLERRGDLQLDRVADHRDAETEAEIAALDRRFGLEADGLDMGHRRGRPWRGQDDGLHRQAAGNPGRDDRIGARWHLPGRSAGLWPDRKSTRLNSSH